jgi:amino acid transporter
MLALRELLFGRPLRSEEAERERIGIVSGIPAVGLDALASAAYGPEAALTILLSLGSTGPRYIAAVSAAVVFVLVAVFASYLQTIPAYPQGGGAYTVAKENLGRLPGLLAASALSIDYVLNVAVAISAGVGAIVSALPALLPYTLPMCLAILALLATVNLRGVRTAGAVFLLPTILFVLCLAATILVGVGKAVLSSGHPVPVVAPARIAPSTTVAGAWLLARSFASGCTALTGVEAVSNAVPIFRRPSIVVARRTLTVIVALLAFLLLGVALLSRIFGITATPPGQPGYESVLSQIMGAVAGRGAFYYLGISAILLVLTLSANTSFTDFPRVCRALALDEFLPAGFAHRGRRLVYSSGIVVLTLLAAALLIAFGGVTDRLIPLFAVGAFTAFTVSQTAMVVHWHRRRGGHARRSLILNGVGAIATSTTLVVMAIAKFREGAWLTLFVMPPLVLLFEIIRRHHEAMQREITEGGALDATGLSEPIVVIPLRRLDRLARKGLRLALTLSADVQAVQVLAEELETEDLSKRWEQMVAGPVRAAGRTAPRLVVLPSPYREFFGPLLQHIENLAAEHRDRHIAVVVPELVERRWYHLLVPHRASLLRDLLLLRGGPQIVIIDTPWYVRG